LEADDVRGLGYNELKKQVLSLLSNEPGLRSGEIAARLTTIHGRSATLRSIEMALLRYYRYGLLRRTGKRGSYVYELSNKGMRRLRWLDGLPTEQLY